MHDNLYHCIVEFFVAYDMVVVTVHLCHDLVQNQLEAFRVCRLTERAVEDLSQLLLDYHAIAAIIKEVKGSMEVISAE